MANIQMDPSRVLGPIKPMHAVGQPPLGGLGKHYFDNFHYLADIDIPYSRLHDVGGGYGGARFVDIPNIFRNFDADPEDPASYDFAFTDALIKALLESGVEPYFRLGITIENQAEIKAYHTDPPKDFDKWACICEHIVAHYIDGWADGFTYPITYWEIWNEPDDGSFDGSRVSQMWTGTPEQYYRLYDITAKRLKARFPQIRVGGYAATGFSAVTDTPEELAAEPRHAYFLEFFHGFMKYIKANSSPIDFFSWHGYDPPEKVFAQAGWLHETLKEYGYGDLPTHINEWNSYFAEKGTAHHSAAVAAMMLGMQNQPGVDMMMIYDARLIGLFAPLFDVVHQKPCQAYYALAAFGMLYKLGSQIAAECDTPGLYAVAARDAAGHGALMISNLTGADQPLTLEGIDLAGAHWYIIDDRRLLSWTQPLTRIENNAVVLIEF